MSSEINPIDTIEDLIHSQDWPYHRVSADVLNCEIAGRWCDYRLNFIWHEESRVMQIFLLYDMSLPPAKKVPVATLMGLLNGQLHMGNFETYTAENCPAFRHGLLLPGTRTLSEALMVEIIEYALDMSEKYYPAFHFVLNGDRAPEEAASMAMVDTVGEA